MTRGISGIQQKPVFPLETFSLKQRLTGVVAVTAIFHLGGG
jgi:hypothetical protein